MSFFPRRVALIAALASVGALSAASGAQANVNPVVSGNNLTVTGDSNDPIAFSIIGENLAVNAVDTGLKADANAQILVDAGIGANFVDAHLLAATNYGSLVINGGEGDDELIGGAGGDTLNGDNGADTLVGFKGADTANGGEGDDVMTWNNGDGSDVNVGGPGNDEVLSNGNNATNELYTYKATGVAEQGELDRIGAGAFKIEFIAERLTVNTLGGDDTVEPDPAALTGLKDVTTITVNGGEGNDTITGGDGNDALNGEAGDDTLVGFKGIDVASGGEGNDTMIWNNGDGSDVNNGEAGEDEVLINGSPTAADEFTYKPDVNAPGRVEFKRTNLVPFTVGFDAERLTVNGLGGDDTMASDPAVPGLGALTALVLNGGDGNDHITGGDGNDTINGDDGNDTLVGFKGTDTANGGEGDDVMTWNNGDGSDVNVGGPGNDEVLSNGNNATNELYTYKATGVAEQGELDRIGAGAFKIEFIAEHLTVNTLGGDDTVEPDPAAPTGLKNVTSITVNGGEGNDTITGGDGADTIVGGPGTDTANGGEGDDVMVWNNGDGTDINNGQAGNDEVLVNGSTQADVLTYKADPAVAGRVVFARTDLVPFTINLEAEKLVVNGGAGNDIMSPEPPGSTGVAGRTTLTLNGGEGDDEITGSDGNDTLNGGVGNDRLVGFKGADTVNGGEGNDVMTWNNGDGTDINNGEAGEDEAQINGGVEADAFSYKPDAVAGRVLVARTNLVPFTVNLEAEKLVVSGHGGDDVMAPDPASLAGLAGRTAMQLIGDEGDDRITGGDGNDELIGGSENDTLVGFKGTDTVKGGTGDDTIVWNNGDGTDPVNAGEAGFDRVEVNGSAAAETMKLTPNGTGATFARTNPGPFTMGISADDEILAVNALAGDDEFAVAAGITGLRVLSSGGAGNDKLVGDAEVDSLFGGSGNDTITGGGGNDLLDGEEGDDQLFARDNVGDLVRGGPGTDAAQADAATVDAIEGVENLDATPPAPPADTKALLPTLGKAAVIRSHRKLVVRIPVSCPATEAGGCKTTVTLETAKAVRLGKVSGVLVLGSKSVSLAAGQQMTLAVNLAAGSEGLAKHGKLATRARIASTDAAGNSAAGSAVVTLHLPRH